MADASTYRIPDQSGRVAVVTGANSGIGLVAARRLAEAGAHVVMACRNPDKAAAALAEVQEAAPRARVEVVQLDLASVASVRAAAEQLRANLSHIDLLVNNAGVMAIPRRLSEDGWEMQLATNHLGHFALTGLLLGPVEASGSGRVVSVSSEAHRTGWINFDDLDGERRYNAWLAYGQSKIANLYFTFELQRRLSASGSPTIATAAHPGWSVTNLQTGGRGVTAGPWKLVMDTANRIAGQSAEMGALPTLHAATSPHVVPAGFYGPGGPGGLRGFPVPVGCAARARDPEVGRRLWEVSEERTGVVFPLARPPRAATRSDRT